MTAIGERPAAVQVGNEHFRPDLAARLIGDSSSKTMEELDRWISVDLDRPGERIEYVRLSPYGSGVWTPEDDHLLLIPGRFGGIQSLAPLGAAMAVLGYDVILPNENRGELVDVEEGLPIAARNQALNVAAVIKELGLQDQRLNVAAHSYGAPILEQLMQVDKKRQWSEATAALVAPAEVLPESRRSFKWRFSFTSKISARLRPVERFSGDGYRDYRDLQTDADEAAYEFEQANPERAQLELDEAATNTIGLETLAGNLARLAVVVSDRDTLFPGRRYAKLSVCKRFDRLTNVVVLTPTSMQPLSKDRPSDEILGRRGSDHCDLSANPMRTAVALDEIFRPERHFIDHAKGMKIPAIPLSQLVQ